MQLSEFQAQSGRDRAALEAQLRQQGFQQAQAARQQDIQNRFGLAQAQSRSRIISNRFSSTGSTITKSRYFTSWSSRCSTTSTKTSGARCTKTSSKTSGIMNH